MSSKWKVLIIAGWMAAGGAVTAAKSAADTVFHPTDYGGNFGIGVEVGDPGDWGVSGKFWVDQMNAFQPAVKFSGAGEAILQLDYLWHALAIVRSGEDGGALPIYIGVGGDLVLESSVTVAARMPLGITWIFDRRQAPIDIFFQVVPTLWFYDAGVHLNLYPEIGAHIYL
jgi:hypothetical protein